MRAQTHPKRLNHCTSDNIQADMPLASFDALLAAYNGYGH